MKLMNLGAAAIFIIAISAFGQDSGCRQPWMPADIPAFCSWQSEPSLPEARTYPALTTMGNHIYVFGGFRFDSSTNQVIYYDSVVQATIGTDGHLKQWTAEPSFKGNRSGASATTANNCVFLVGGSTSTPTSLIYYDDVQYARIGNDGHLSAWTTSTNHLKVARSNLSLVAVKNGQDVFLNAVAGVTQSGSDTVHLDTIEVAKIGDGCTVGNWTVANYHLKGGRSTPQAIAVTNKSVVIGGWGDLDQIDVYDDVQTTTARSDGSPNPWRVSANRLTSGLYGHATVLTSPENARSPSLLLSVGGQPGTGAYANWINYSYVQPGIEFPQAIGIWRIAGTGRLPTGRAGLVATEFKNRLYVIGGNDANGQYFREVLSALFDPGHP